MDDTFIIIVFLVFDELPRTFLGTPKYRPKMTPAEIMLVAVVAAPYFNNNLERALIILGETHYISKAPLLSVSRFNCQLHPYARGVQFYMTPT